MLWPQDNAQTVGTTHLDGTITHQVIVDIAHYLVVVAHHHNQYAMLGTQEAIVVKWLLQIILPMQTKEVKLGQKCDIVRVGCKKWEILLTNGPQVDFFSIQHNQICPSYTRFISHIIS